MIITAAQSSKRKWENNRSLPSLNGAWQWVYHHDGKTATTVYYKEFVVVYDGFFSSIGQDAEGLWTNTDGGSFLLNGKLTKNHLLYSSRPDILGFTNRVEYELKTYTLTLKGNIKKMITPHAQEITVDRQLSESKYIKAKDRQHPFAAARRSIIKLPGAPSPFFYNYKASQSPLKAGGTQRKRCL